jgi:hypothetical protein
MWEVEQLCPLSEVADWEGFFEMEHEEMEKAKREAKKGRRR